MPEVSELLRYTIWIGAIGVAALLIGVYASRALRKRLREQKRADAFTIQELRQMRDAGGITPQEYEAMRATVIAQMRAASPTRSRKDLDPQIVRDPEVADNAGDPAPDGAPDD